MNITFRSFLLGSVIDFCQESGLALTTPEIVAELIVRLARYKEEGVKLSPKVYLTNNIGLLVNMLPESDIISLSTTTISVKGIEEMLKVCAPLATNEWNIFGQQTNGNMEFGLFRGSGNPVSVSVDDVILKDQNNVDVIKAQQVANECVFIRNSKGICHHVFLNHRRDESPPPLEFLERLVRSATKNVRDEIKESTQSFLTKMLSSILAKSHGCILTVTNLDKPPKMLSEDAILLTNPIDFPDLIEKIVIKNGDETFSHSIRSNSELLEGMICSDGITVLDNRGRVLAYRCFINLPSGKSKVVGGARKRAYEELKSRLGKDLSSAFFQSQDGLTEFEETSDD